MKATIKSVFYALIVVFVLLVSYFFIPFEKRVWFLLLAFLGLLFLVLGIVLIYLALRLKGRQKKFFLLTGISAICPLVFSILHNLFYALEIVSEGVVILEYLFGFLHVASFIISLLIAPIGFIVGVIGSLYLIKKS